jgi:uncharacterized protein YndB with AHSA1/START domain
LTEPDSIARWLGSIPTRVRESEDERFLELDWEPPGDEPSVVRFELTPLGAGTQLTLDHRRINAVQGGLYSERWVNTLLRLDELFGGER